MAEILILSLVFRPDNVSTAQLMADLAGDLQGRGHTVSVLTTTPHYNLDPDAASKQPMTSRWGGLLWQSDFRGVKVFHARMPKKGTNILYRTGTWSLFHIISTLAGLWLVKKPDVIFSPSPPLTIGISAWLLAMYHRAPFIYGVQEMYPDVAINLGAIRNPALIYLLYKVEMAIYSRAAAITVISERMKARIIEKGVPGRKLHLIPNFADIHTFQPVARDNDFARMHGLLDKVVVLYAGNMGKPQQLDLIVHAANLVRECRTIHFLLMGDGSERRALLDLAAKLRLENITFLPYQPYATMPFAYAAADLSYVSQAFRTSADGIPSKVYRIMASGIPVIASTDPMSDLADLIRGTASGVVVTAADPAQLARAIQEVIADKSACSRMGANGRDYVVKNVERRIVVSRYESILVNFGKGSLS